MEINDVKLPSKNDFNSTARVFLRMFNESLARYEPRGYVVCVDEKLKCYWGRTDGDVKLFSDKEFEPGSDAVVLSAAFLYSKVFPSPTATIRDVRQALAEGLSHFAVDSKEEIVAFYCPIPKKIKKEKKQC
ncbi:MAG: hypothetical protein IJE97_15745 [Thermoguttaceae bacterium]|nr:hypothetical protein [Thermoguttaceae bacterium]MBQ6827468.1 hypothetical protein [Thermoguttaceae bacterium]MBQ7112186.1 hypothetical protein [Thermoguttaceae bacterium]